MGLTSEDLLAISQLLDVKIKSALQEELQPVKDDIREIKLDIENYIKPSIHILAENYAPAAKRFEKASNQLEAIQTDLSIIKKVITEHSGKLQRIS